MPFLIREATPADAADIVTLIRELANFEKLGEQADPDEERLVRHLSRNAQPRAEAVLAIDDETSRSIGFALYFQSYSTFLTRWGIYLEDLYVVPDFRGKGVGRALLAHVARTAIELGCERLEWSVLDWNTSAIKFYRDLGASALQEWVPMRITGDDLERLALGDG